MRHVLVIEVEYLLAQCVADMATYAGASSVEIVESAAMAVEAARRHLPTIIISDIDLKEGGRGPDAVASICALCGTVPAIFVTGNPEDEQARALGVAVLGKPVSLHQLAATFQLIAADSTVWQEVMDAAGASNDHITAQF